MTTSLGEIWQEPPVWFGLMFVVTIVSAMVFVALRLGLLATIVMFFVNFVLASAVVTLNPSSWFFSQSAAVLLMVAALTLYGFIASRAGEPLFGRRILD
jgi:hypothetical protein